MGLRVGGDMPTAVIFGAPLRLLRRSRRGLLRSDGSQPSKLEGVEIITCPPLIGPRKRKRNPSERLNHL